MQKVALAVEYVAAPAVFHGALVATKNRRGRAVVFVLATVRVCPSIVDNILHLPRFFTKQFGGCFVIEAVFVVFPCNIPMAVSLRRLIPTAATTRNRARISIFIFIPSGAQAISLQMKDPDKFRQVLVIHIPQAAHVEFLRSNK